MVEITEQQFVDLCAAMDERSTLIEKLRKIKASAGFRRLSLNGKLAKIQPIERRIAELNAAIYS